MGLLESNLIVSQIQVSTCHVTDLACHIDPVTLSEGNLGEKKVWLKKTPWVILSRQDCTSKFKIRDLAHRWHCGELEQFKNIGTEVISYMVETSPDFRNH